MKIAQWLVPAVVMLAALGCGKSDVPESQTPAGQRGPTVAREGGDATTPVRDGDSFVPPPVVNTPAAKLPVTPNSPPDEVVIEFLNAMKTGNDGVAAGLLTAKAREETGRYGLAVQPPGSPNAEYEVTAGEIAEDDPTLAQVGCLWIERDDSDEEHSQQVVWVLRKGSEGWRVCGMATVAATREDPVFFDFEDPAEMIALMDEIQREMQAAAVATPSDDEESPLRQARNPKNDNNSLRE